jgi:hypothetical protein
MRLKLSSIHLGACALLALGGCAHNLQLGRIEAASRKPSNVAVFFSVDDSKGEPVADLLASDFNIYEDDKLVSVDESRQTIVNPEIAATHYTLLLVDMSASVTASDQVQRIVAAANEFISRVEKYQRVAVYAFDGSKQLYEITPFVASGGTQATQGLAALQTFRTRDPSTNLNGAVTQAIDVLDDALAKSTVPLRFGTLVVFTDGTDRAARVPLQEMVDKVEGSEHAIYAIGVGHEIDDSTLSRIGKSGYIRVEDSGALGNAFNQIGDRIVHYTRRYYLLSYCSPARAGKHKVTIEAKTKNGKGRLDYDFNATGFGPDCDPNRPPPFDTTGRSKKLRKKLSGTNLSEPNTVPLKAETKADVKAGSKADAK